MTTRNLLLAVLLFVSSMTLSANHTYPYGKNPEMRLELAKYLKSANLTSATQETITVSFLVNSNHEVVVIATSNEDFENTIKGALNYKSIKTSNFEVNKIYILPLKINKTKVF
jgi:hypothetical protein